MAFHWKGKDTKKGKDFLAIFEKNRTFTNESRLKNARDLLVNNFRD